MEPLTGETPHPHAYGVQQLVRKDNALGCSCALPYDLCCLVGSPGRECQIYMNMNSLNAHVWRRGTPDADYASAVNKTAMSCWPDLYEFIPLVISKSLMEF